MPIRVLPPEISSKIAAGEVVERPSSVVKELVENSLDAGATQISVEGVGGGVRLIKVADNGVGIPPDEVELVFERYATSKISSSNDLGAIATLGFRGEALPSIAAVAEISLSTNSSEETTGTFIHLKNGVVAGKTNRACPQGTTVTVHNLFRNIPARLKFLRSTTTENAHISNLIVQYALAFPEVKFTLALEERTAFRSPGNGKLSDVLIEAHGLATARAMLEVNNFEETSTVALSGFVSPPHISRSNRSCLSFFVNRRWVQSQMLAYAAESAYQNMLMKGRHPIVVLNIFLPPEGVDVNVHPTKREVKFRHEREVFNTVQKTLKETLTALSPVPPVMNISSQPQIANLPHPFIPEKEETAATFPLMPQNETKPSSQAPNLRVLGQLQNTYITAEGGDGMYLIDQHAAHERVLFEKIQEQQRNREVEIQGLLEPLTLELTVQQEEVMKSHLRILSEHGFEIEPFGERTYLLRSVPTLLKGKDNAQVILDLLDSLEKENQGDFRENVAASLACHGAIRAGQKLSFEEMQELVRQLEQTKSPRTCPHGRPTMIYLSSSQLEKEFGRR